MENYQYNDNNGIISCEGLSERFTSSENIIFSSLFSHKGFLVNTNTIMAALYGGLEERSLSVLHSFVYKINKKIERTCINLKVSSIKNRGYILIIYSRPS